MARQESPSPSILSEKAIALIQKRKAEADAAERGALFDPSVLETPQAIAWRAQLVEQARGDGRLVTDQQYVDHVRGRWFERDDRARYVGPARLEGVTVRGEKRQVLRPTGQLGTIASISTDGGRRAAIFQPDVNEVQRAAAGDAEANEVIVRLPVVEGVNGFDLERVPGS